MGGIGKTELALQYALADRDKDPKTRIYQAGICWINVSKEGNVGTQILNFASEYLKLPIPEEGELEDRVKLCWQNWRQGNTLIIFDDVREYRQIKDYLPPQEKSFKVIITTRKQRLADSIKVLALEVLEEQPALELIASLIGQERVNSQLKEAKGLCKDLGYLPLGLELVARFLIRRKRWSIKKMREKLSLTAKPLAEAREDMTGERGVQAAFNVSWEELTDEAQTVALYLSLFAVAPIPYDFIQKVCPIEDEDELEEILEDSLIELSLIKDLGEEWYEIHTLIQQYLRDKLEESKLATTVKQTYCQLMTEIAQEIPEMPVQSDIQNLTPVIPHLVVAARELNQWIVDDDLIWVYVGLGRFYEGQGLYQEAEPWYEQCLSIVRERLGENYPDVAISLNNLAGLYESQGRYDEAKPLYLQALELRKRLLGEDHPDVATSLNNLAGLYDSQGRYDEAEPLYLQALELRKRLLGEDHPDVAQSLNNLARLYNSKGRYDEAEPLYLQALELLTRQLGEDHPHVATSLNNLALLYDLQGRYDEAEPLYLQALELRKRQLREDHPHVATSLNNLARFYDLQGRYDEAEPLYLQALELLKKQLGEDHPNVAISLNNLAGLYDSQGRYDEAEPLYLQALELRRRLLREDHPHVATSLNNLAVLYYSQGRYDEAEPLLLQALKISEKALGKNHPNTNTIQVNYEKLKKR